MTMAELYAAPEKLDGGAAMVETIKAEVGKLNGESKEQREAKEKAARQEIEMTQSVWAKIRNECICEVFILQQIISYRQFKTDLPNCRRNKQKAFRNIPEGLIFCRNYNKEVKT